MGRLIEISGDLLASDVQYIAHQCNCVTTFGKGLSHGPHDTAQLRQQWFRDCLDQIDALPDLREIAFPYLIGCGLAGGDWKIYLQMLEDWFEASSLERVFLIRK